MKNMIKKLAAPVAVLAVAVFMAFVPVHSAAAACGNDYSAANGIECAKGADTPSTLFGQGSVFTTIVNVMLFIIGALSVIMLIYGGIRYTTSGGASGSVTAAKNTIMYAIIGLVVAFLAYAIVNWVLSDALGGLN